MIGFEISKPLYTDQMTRTREWLEYAHLMVDILVGGKRINRVSITLPIGVQLDLEVVYKMVPYFYEDCQRIGHRKETYYIGDVLADHNSNSLDVTHMLSRIKTNQDGKHRMIKIITKLDGSAPNQ